MKIRNTKLHGGRHPSFACKCGTQIDPQGKGQRPVVDGYLLCGPKCPYIPKSPSK